MSDQSTRPLADVAHVKMGQSPPGSTYNDAGHGLPFYQGIADFGQRYPRLRVYCTAPSRLAGPGDVLVSVRAPIGQINVATTECAIGRGIAAVRPHDREDAEFLEFILRSLSSEWDILEGGGSVFGAAKRADLERLPIVWPSPSERRAIGRILGALDDKVELNRRMNETLARISSEHFREAYWHSPHRTTWSEERLGEHLEVVRGLSYAGAGLSADGLPLHNLNSVSEGGGYKRDGLKWYSGEFKERHVVRAGDVIVANTDLTWNFQVIASPAIIPGDQGDAGLFSHHLYRVRPKAGSPLTPSLVYLLLLAGPLRTEVAGYANGTTVNMLPQDALQKPVFRVPPPDLARQLDELVKPLFAQAEHTETESETLAELRDTLLPKLISGELRVRDAEQAIGRVS